MSVGLFVLVLCLVLVVIVLGVMAGVFYQDKQRIVEDRQAEIAELLDQTERRVEAWVRGEEQRLRNRQRQR